MIDFVPVSTSAFYKKVFKMDSKQWDSSFPRYENVNNIYPV